MKEVPDQANLVDFHASMCILRAKMSEHIKFTLFLGSTVQPRQYEQELELKANVAYGHVHGVN